MNDVADQETFTVQDDEPKIENVEQVIVETEPIVEKIDSVPKPAPQIPVPDALEQLRQELERSNKETEQERNFKLAAQKQAQDAMRQAAAAKAEVHTANVQVVSNSIDALSKEMEIIRTNMSNAMAMGDWTEFSNLQEKMSVNAAKIVNLENNKISMQQKPPEQFQTQPQYQDPVDAFANSIARDGWHKSADWIRRHPECVTNKHMLDLMVSTHKVLTEVQGIPAESPAYFQRMEDMLGYTPVRLETPNPQIAVQPVRKSVPASPASAPVSRSPSESNTFGRISGNRVTLSAEQRECADAMGMSYQSYANNLYAIKTGKGKR